MMKPSRWAAVSGDADEQALAALLAADPGLGVEQGVEGADVEPLGGERELADLEPALGAGSWLLTSLISSSPRALGSIDRATSTTLLS